MIRLSAALRATLLLLTLLLFLPAGAAQAAVTARAGIPASTVNGGEDLGASLGKPLLGGVLEWGEDDAAGFAGRLQATPGGLGTMSLFPSKAPKRATCGSSWPRVPHPGAHALITVNPTVPLAEGHRGGRCDFAAQLEDLTEGFPGKLLIRFAPDMNASWVSWGQQPGAYVPAYRAMAEAFESRTSDALMVWQPFQGRDYPFTRNRNAPAPGTPGFAALDTNSDGAWNGFGRAVRPVLPGRRRR